MCRTVQCEKCGKTTWTGCGQHVQIIMQNIPQQDRCKCNRIQPTTNPFRQSKRTNVRR